MSNKIIKVLYADEDIQTANFYKELLVSKKYHVECAYDYVSAWKSYCKVNPDIILLEVSIFNANAYKIFRLIRAENTKTPIILVGSRKQSLALTTGLHLGINDYISKELFISEIELRINAQLNFTDHSSKKSVIFRIGTDTLFIPLEQRIIIAYKSIFIPSIPSRILLLLCKENQIITIQEIIKKCWNNDYSGNKRYIYKNIMFLRKILKSDPSVKLMTIRNEGYFLASRQ